MPRKSTTRRAQGEGTIRQRKDGTWEARYTLGRDPGTGKQIQKSVYGATQKDVRQKLQQIAQAIDEGTYFEPTKMTVAGWMNVWLKGLPRQRKSRNGGELHSTCKQPHHSGFGGYEVVGVAAAADSATVQRPAG